MNITRHKDLLKEKTLDKQIHIVGCGSIGSFLAQSLVRMGFNDFYLWDFDIVKEHNLANQGYYQNQEGQKKTTALKTILVNIDNTINVVEKGHFTNKEIERMTINDKNKEIIICSCLDNMNTRISIIKEMFKRQANKIVFLDGRMSSEQAQVYLFNYEYDKDNLKDYKTYYERNIQKYFYEDEQSHEGVCTNKSNVFTANIISGYMIKTLLDYDNYKKSNQPNEMYSSVKLIDIKQWEIHKIK